MGSHRWNQHRARVTRERGSSDMDWADKDRVRRWAYDEFGVDVDVYTDAYLLLYDEDPPRHVVVRSLPQEARPTGARIRHPDVAIMDTDRDGQRYLVGVVEVDGAVHRARDVDREYVDYRVPHCVINKEHMAATDSPWEDWLSERVASVGLAGRLTLHP